MSVISTNVLSRKQRNSLTFGNCSSYTWAMDPLSAATMSAL